ncbi:MAG: M48 family metalloprotease [Pseudomonadales bacterium]
MLLASAIPICFQITSRILAGTLLIVTLFVAASGKAADTRNLPQLGDRASSIISLEQERELGQDFLRSLRAQAPTISDPILQEYLEHLIYKLALNSELQDRSLELIIIDADSINAFAAPGGIVGVHDGLFVYAETEDEISAILAHELAHLSQRHFARRSDAGRQASMTSLAGLLAGIVLIAAGSGDAGLAAMTAGQAATQGEMLRYSRAWESEADRVGIRTLVDAGKDPRAMAAMFERLERANRFQTSRIPEFLLTHPVTRDRIADSYNQALQYPNREYQSSLDYQLMRARVIVNTSRSPRDAISRMQADLDSADPVKRAASQYGLTLAYTESGQFERAMDYLNALKKTHNGKIAVMLAEASLHNKAARYDEAGSILKDALRLSPGNYPLTMAYADVLLKQGKPERAQNVLVPLTSKRPNDVHLWYTLAETYGLANNIVGVHEARAEYFVLVGNFDQAITQLGYAIPLVTDNFQKTASIRTRIEEIHQMRMKREQRNS